MATRITRVPMKSARGSRAALVVLGCLLVFAPGGAEASELDRCLAEQGLPRVARIRGPDGRPVYGLVTDAKDGRPTAIVPIADGALDLASVFERAAAPPTNAPVLALAANGAGVCSPVRLDQSSLDAEELVVVAAGLNYAAHADEAGGGDVFLFPKPVAPTPPYGEVRPPKGVVLLDYEVELAFVLLADVYLRALPTRDELLAQSAFFVANEVSDREPIIRQKALSGPGTGFVEGKGQPGFFPAGPWMVRGSELFAALARCGEAGLGIRLGVDEGDGFRPRQDATTAAMILDPLELLGKIAEVVATDGLHTPMPVKRTAGTVYYPLAVDGQGPRLPAGSVVLTGTPEGVAVQAPRSVLAVTARGLLHMRNPLEQFLLEERERAMGTEPGGYLRPGQRVRAEVDGLGAQVVRIADAGATALRDPCGED